MFLTEQQLETTAIVFAYTQIVSAAILTVVDLVFLVKVRCQQQYKFMIKLLVLILVITLSSIAIMVVNALVIKNLVDKLDIDVTLIVLNFLFWMSAFLCVWLIAFKYHEHSRQLLRIEKLTNIRKQQLNKSARMQGSSGQAPEAMEPEISI
jgi:hypothetical protein